MFPLPSNPASHVHNVDFLFAAIIPYYVTVVLHSYGMSEDGVVEDESIDPHPTQESGTTYDKSQA